MPTLTRAYDDAGYFSCNVRTIEVIVDRDSDGESAEEQRRHIQLKARCPMVTNFDQQLAVQSRQPHRQNAALERAPIDSVPMTAAPDLSKAGMA
jgi:hypothetical protein